MLLLALALLNGLFIQAYSSVPLPLSAAHTMPVAHESGHSGGEHVDHAQAVQNDCLTSDAVCKTKCAWSCQLSQAVTMLASPMPIVIRYAIEVPVYFKHERPSSFLDLGLRPPIST
jgi:hypothetical protein